MAPWAGACCRTRAFGELGRELNAHILMGPKNGVWSIGLAQKKGQYQNHGDMSAGYLRTEKKYLTDNERDVSCISWN
jgi:hypothetical protein